MRSQPARPSRPHLTREDVLDVREVADLLHIPPSTIFDYARRGLLPGHKLGRRWIFLRDELDAAVRTAPRAGGTTPLPQPPVLHRPPAAKTTLKRYPMAVPWSASGQQQPLFD
jgi:excisionase family DNA binding protein